MECKIRVKVRNIEIEYEGTATYLKDNLPELIEFLANLPSAEEAGSESEEEEIFPEVTDPSKKKIELTTNTIAGRLDAKSGADLALAACAHLHLVKAAETFHRKNILAEMRLADNYFRSSFANNLTSSLKSLVKDEKLIERTRDTYALDAKTLSQLETRLTL
jgi:hypothetical protein